MVVKLACIARAMEYFSDDGPDLCTILSPRIIDTFPSKIHTHKTGEKNN